MPAVVRPVVHLELHTGALGDACAFYSQVLGWRAEPLGPRRAPYRSLQVGPGLGGGVVECGTVRPLWLPYVEVPEVQAAAEAAMALGASLLLEPRRGPAGWRAVVASAAGGEIGFWQPGR